MSTLQRPALALALHAASLGLCPSAFAAETWAPTPAETELVRALSARDGAPSCAELEAMVPAPVGSLQSIVEHVTMPPWVGMRAADCILAGHAAESRTLIESWVTRPELKGLGILTLGRLDAMPADIATAIATKAIEAGPDTADARKRVARSSRPEIAALATTIPLPVAPVPR